MAREERELTDARWAVLEPLLPRNALLLPALLDAGAVKRSAPTGRPGRGRPRKRPEQLAADKGYSYPSVWAELRRRGIGAVIPTRSDSVAGRGSTGRPTPSATGSSGA